MIGHCWGAGSQVMLCTWSADHPSSILASVWGPLADPCSPLVGPSWAPAVAGTRPGCELASALPEPSAFPRHTSPHVACTPWPPRVACTSWPPTWPLAWPPHMVLLHSDPPSPVLPPASCTSWPVCLQLSSPLVFAQDPLGWAQVSPQQSRTVALPWILFLLSLRCLQLVLRTVESEKVTQSCPTVHDPMDYSPWTSPGQNPGVGSLSLLQALFPAQG